MKYGFCIWTGPLAQTRKVWVTHTWGHEKKSVWTGDGYQEFWLESFSCKTIPSNLGKCPRHKGMHVSCIPLWSFWDHWTLRKQCWKKASLVHWYEVIKLSEKSLINSLVWSYKTGNQAERLTDHEEFIKTDRNFKKRHTILG